MRSVVVWLTIATSAAFGAGFKENFDSLPGVPPDIWSVMNNSVPVGTTNWFQGDGAVFPSHQGASESYAATTFTSAELGGESDNWLISPLLKGGSMCSNRLRTTLGLWRASAG